MNNVVPFSRRSIALSETSVTSPIRPPAPRRPEEVRRPYRNSESGVLPTPQAQRLQAAVNRMPVATHGQPINDAPAGVQAAPEPKPSKLKRLVLGLGALSGFAIVPGLISIVALGPLGLAVAGGCAALSAALIAIGSRMR